MNYIDWKQQYFPDLDDSESLKNAYNAASQSIVCPKRVGVYAISANPPTWGHADIMMRASQHMDEFYWVCAHNPNKHTLFSLEDKLKMMQIYVDYYKLSNVKVQAIEGATARFAQKVKAQYLIRGLRSSSDYQYEFELSVGNRGISKDIETLCLFTKPHYATISSSIVRELAVLGEQIAQYVHPKVRDLILKILKENK